MTKKTTTDEVQLPHGAQAAERLVAGMGALVAAMAAMEEADPGRAAETLEDQELADATALVQDIRARLNAVERDLATALGRSMGKGVGALSDGRQFTLSRGADRKEWDHDDWKRDARRAIVQRYKGDQDPIILNPETGEPWERTLAQALQEAIAEAQEVHGSTAPRSTALKRLGLYASDYCTSSPAGWTFRAVKPTPVTTEDATDA